MICDYLDLSDYLRTAEAACGVSAGQLAQSDRLGLVDFALNAPAAAFCGTEYAPRFSRKAAILCRHLIESDPLSNEGDSGRCALLCLREFVARNGYEWAPAPRDPAETEAVVRGVAAGTIDEDELERWIRERIGEPADA